MQTVTDLTAEIESRGYTIVDNLLPSVRFITAQKPSQEPDGNPTVVKITVDESRLEDEHYVSQKLAHFQ